MDFYETISTLISPLMQGMLVSIGIGLMIGLEREFNTQSEETHLAGLRTFPLVGLLGNSFAVISAQLQSSFILLASIIGFFGVVMVAYYAQTQKGKLGLTTPSALLITFALGVLVSTGLIKESVAIAVSTATILSLKEQLHGFATRITTDEMAAFIKFFVMALLLLPFLPNQSFGPENLLNARDIGWIVVIVSSISFAGYLGLKFGGLQKGILFTALIGGLFSSTMVAWVFSQKSQETPAASATYGGGIVLSSSIMFLRILLLSFLFNPLVAKQLLLPMLLLFVLSLGAVYWAVRHSEKQAPVENFPLGNPLDFKNALFFVLLYLSVTMFVFYSRAFFGQTGAYISGAISGIADLDAITISTAKWSIGGTDKIGMAARIILIASLANTVFKWAVSATRGTAEVRRWASLGFGAILLVGSILLAVI